MVQWHEMNEIQNQSDLQLENFEEDYYLKM